MDTKVGQEKSIKVPPQNIEAEQIVLGSILLEKNALIKVADLLTPEDFYNPANEKIYRTILELYEKNQPIDILTVTNRLKEKKLLADVGGSSYLAELVNIITTTSHVDYYARIVKEKRVLRDLIKISAEITEKAFDPSKEFEIFLDEIEQKILSISQKSLPQNFTHIKDELISAYERIEKLHEKKRLLRGLSTGFIELDNLLSGLQKSDFIVVGARPSLGKTSFALDIARNVALKEQVPVGVFSLEMSREQVVDRLISAQSGVALWKLRTGKLSDDLEFQMIQKALNDLSSAPIFIDDTPSPNILQMRSMARRLQVEKGLGLIVVDYLQLIVPRYTNSQASMVQQVTEISRGLKGLARELNVPVLAISQLSRSVDKRDNRVPQLSDLRESGCLSADSLIMNALTGELVTIKDLAENKAPTPFFVYTLSNDWKLEIKPVIRAFSSGYKKIYELKTRSGQVIKASANHPFRKLDKWARLDELKVGDRIALPRKIIPLNPKNSLQDDELILLAHLIGDGCVLPKQPIHYTSADLENIEYVKNSAKKLFNIEGKLIKQKNWYHLYLTSPYKLTKNKHHPIINWFNQLKIKPVRSYEKEIPQDVFLCNNEKIKIFLGHLWATDGNILWKKSAKRKQSAVIYYSTTSFKLALQIKHLLLRLGILSYLKTVDQKKYRPIYQIHIYGKENQLRFLENIPVVGQKGKIIPDLIRALKEINSNPNFDVVPKEAWQILVLPEKINAGISWRDLQYGINTSYCGTALLKTGISRQRLNRLALVLESEKLKNLAFSDIYWDEIVSITPLEIEEVYDLTVKDNHNFIANDIIVHNSIEQDADVVLFIYRKDRDDPNTPPEEQGIAEIKIAKHRNGPLGSVKLRFDSETVSFKNIDKKHTDDLLEDF